MEKLEPRQTADAGQNTDIDIQNLIVSVLDNNNLSSEEKAQEIMGILKLEILSRTEGNTNVNPDNKKAVQNNASVLSQSLAFVLIIIFIAAGVFLTIKGHENIGGTIFGTTIVGVASIFIMGSLKKRKQ